jgi:hypothetical protein
VITFQIWWSDDNQTIHIDIVTINWGAMLHISKNFSKIWFSNNMSQSHVIYYFGKSGTKFWNEILESLAFLLIETYPIAFILLQHFVNHSNIKHACYITQLLIWSSSYLWIWAWLAFFYDFTTSMNGILLVHKFKIEK